MFTFYDSTKAKLNIYQVRISCNFALILVLASQLNVPFVVLTFFLKEVQNAWWIKLYKAMAWSGLQLCLILLVSLSVPLLCTVSYLRPTIHYQSEVLALLICPILDDDRRIWDQNTSFLGNNIVQCFFTGCQCHIRLAVASINWIVLDSALQFSCDHNQGITPILPKYYNHQLQRFDKLFNFLLLVSFCM